MVRVAAYGMVLRHAVARGGLAGARLNNRMQQAGGVVGRQGEACLRVSPGLLGSAPYSSSSRIAALSPSSSHESSDPVLPLHRQTLICKF